jgi:hypothetical protein
MPPPSPQPLAAQPEQAALPWDRWLGWCLSAILPAGVAVSMLIAIALAHPRTAPSPKTVREPAVEDDAGAQMIRAAVLKARLDAYWRQKSSPPPAPVAESRPAQPTLVERDGHPVPQ